MFKKNDKVVKILNTCGLEVASIKKIVAVDKKRGLVSIDESHVSKPSDIQEDGVQTYRLSDGTAMVSYIPGCSTRLVRLED